MGRHLFIESRLQSCFNDYLVERFADDPNVSVIRDRRVGERRRFPRGVAPGGERRRGERRRRQHLDAELQTHSHIIVELND